MWYAVFHITVATKIQSGQNADPAGFKALDIQIRYPAENQYPSIRNVHTLFSANIDATRRHMVLQIVGGRAFLEHLNNDAVDSSLTVHIHFRGQRFQSQPTPCACEPDFNEAFVFEIHKETSGSLHHYNTHQLSTLSVWVSLHRLSTLQWWANKVLYSPIAIGIQIAIWTILAIRFEM